MNNSLIKLFSDTIYQAIFFNTGLPLYLEKPGFFNNFYMFSSKISIWHKNSIVKIYFFCHYPNLFSLKYIFKVALQYPFNVFIFFNTVFNLKLNFKQKIDPKMLIFKNLEEIWKTWKEFGKNKWRSC